MGKFKVGDHVERVSSVIPDTRTGVIKRVIPNNQGHDIFTEYEIEFSDGETMRLYETQIRPIKPA